MKRSHLSSPDQELQQESFLSRWSRRKLGRESEADADPPAPVAATAQEASLPTDEDMPPLESLTEDSDYSGFLSPSVSETLRKAALRKLFHSSAFNLCDGLDDYDEDFRNFAALGDLVTEEMRRRMEHMAEALESESQAVAAAPQSDAEAQDSVADVADDENEDEEVG
jgi:Protein of unknown function (DUF3306).